MKRLLLTIFILHAAASCFSQSSRLSEQAGNVVRRTPLAHGYAYELTNGYAKITAYNPTTIRVRVGRKKFTQDLSYAIDDLTPRGSFSLSGTDLLTDSLKVVVNEKPF